MFHEFERQVLEVVKSRLDKANRELFEKQIDAVNKIQRSPEGREVNCYRKRRGRPAADDELRFACDPGEVLMSSMILKSPETAAKMRTDVWLVNGIFFSIEFNRSPTKFFAGQRSRNAAAEVIDITMWPGPSQQVAAEHS